jgi:hypothetical protein
MWQIDPVFRSTFIYAPRYIKELNQRLITRQTYTEARFPSIRTLSNEVN